jgi:hypothetical protein
MPFYKCTVCLDDGSEVCRDVPTTIETTERDGRTEWYGTITIPHLTTLEAGKRYRLLVEDGRSGEFLVRRNTFAGGENRAVAIHGTGALS